MIPFWRNGKERHWPQGLPCLYLPLYIFVKSSVAMKFLWHIMYMWKYLYQSVQLFLHQQVLFELIDNEDSTPKEKEKKFPFPLSYETCFKYLLQICIPNVFITCVVFEMSFNVPILGQNSFWKQELLPEVPGWKVGFVKLNSVGIWWTCLANKWDTIKILRECPNEVCMRCVDITVCEQ